jgi:coenzyme F420-dependent glucose-6-phosphate dehydrogenase
VVEIGYKLSSEEHGPRELVRLAARAEDTGFSFAAISDHIHPWIDEQGHSPFVWGVIGGIAEATSEIEILTGVTCPTVRIHPAIIAHAAATAGVMLPGRFLLGLGSGENLNEHVLGDRWPEVAVRLEMLDEAVEVVRLLWEGGLKSHHGRHYTVENARLYDIPEEPPPVLIAASGASAVDLAGRIGDGLVSLAPVEGLLDRYDRAGGTGKPRYAEVTVCWGPDEEEAQRVAHRYWPVAAIKGQLSQELAVPSHFEQAAEMTRPEDVAATVACGPDPEKHIAGAQQFIDAGYDHIWFHQVGPDQEGFFDFYAKEVLPQLR